MREIYQLPDGVFPDSHSIEELRKGYGRLLRFLYGRGQTQENAIILFIGGGAAVGKSTLAWYLGSVMGIRTIIGTDVIRQIVRHERPSDYMIQSETWAIGKTPGDQKYVQNEYHGLAMQSARLETVIESLCVYLLGKGMTSIVEGIHLIPSAALMRLSANPKCIVFFVDATEARLRSNYKFRAVSTHMRNPLEGFSSIDRRIRLHNQIIKNALASGLPVLLADHWPKLIKDTMTLVSNKLGL